MSIECREAGAGPDLRGARQAEIDDTVRQFSHAWSIFARKTPRGEVVETPGLILACAGVAWPVMNAAFLADPVLNLEDLDQRLKTASQFFAARRLSSILALTDDWIAEPLRAAAQEQIAAHGFQAALKLEGMACSRFLAPKYPPPKGIEIRRIRDEQSRIAAATINAIAYEIPQEWAFEAITSPSFWLDETQGWLLYADGQPVSCAAVILTRQTLYVGLVATLPEYRRRGLGEAVMRHGLEIARKETGFQRSVLHSTPEGFALYKQMGYLPTTSFTVYLHE